MVLFINDRDMNKKSLYKKLKAVDIEGFDISLLAPRPAGNYVAVKRVGNIAYVSGQMPVYSTGMVLTAQEHTTIDFGYKAARLAMANVLKQLLNFSDIEEVVSIVRVDGYFNHDNGKDIPKMLDGASDLIAELFDGKDGEHARTVFTIKSLPYNAFVELVVIAEVK